MPHYRNDVQGLTWEEGPAAPCRAAAWPTAPPPGGGLPPGAKMRLKINFIYIQVPTARLRGGGRGTKL